VEVGEHLREKESNSTVLRVKSDLSFSTTHTKEYFMSQTLLEMTKDLVMVQIEAHSISPNEMHQALQQTYGTLQAL